MGAIMNGMAYYGLFRVSGSTFLVFSDYMRASVRVAALSHLPTSYIWTHDSIGVGEDGPTHQPVETVSSLRLIPNLDVMRPGDAEETAAAYVHSIERQTETTALKAIILAAGSELSMAVAAAAELGSGVRVVSMPCMELYERQSAEYKESVLPAAMKSKTVACEAGVTLPWYKFADKVMGVDSFGLSAPGDEVYEEKGMTVANLV